MEVRDEHEIVQVLCQSRALSTSQQCNEQETLRRTLHGCPCENTLRTHELQGLHLNLSGRLVKVLSNDYICNRLIVAFRGWRTGY